MRQMGDEPVHEVTLDFERSFGAGDPRYEDRGENWTGFDVEVGSCGGQVLKRLVGEGGVRFHFEEDEGP